MGEVQEVAANGSGLGQVTLGLCPGENSLSEVLEFLKELEFRRSYVGILPVRRASVYR